VSQVPATGASASSGPATTRPRPPAVIAPALIALALALPADAAAQGPTRAQVARVDSIFRPWSDPAGPGAAVAVTRNGRIIYSQGYGSAQLEYRVPVTPTTIFHVASVSKQFTTFAVALLARDGLLSWDDPVQKHLPEVPDLGHRITLRQLAQHTSGVRDQWELLIQAGWRIDDVITRDQIMDLMKRQRELNFVPGSEYLYSNMGYSLLAEVVERVSGTAFGEFLEERVFLPLGMHRTHVHSDHTRVVPGRAYSYAADPAGGWRNAVLSYANQGATSLFTTVEDLARWMAEMEEPAVGDRALWAEMAAPTRLSNGDTSHYGLGLSVAPWRGLATRGHGGADAGFRTFLLHLPTERLGVVVFGNAASFNSAAAARRVAEVFLGDRLGPDQDALAPRPRVAVAQRVLDELSGRYRLDAGAMVDVERQGQDLRLVMGNDTHTAVPESETAFWVAGLQGRLTFQRDPAGRLEGFAFQSADGTFRARRIEVAALSSTELAEFTGAYYSPELDVVYRIVAADGTLAVHRPRQPPVALFATAKDRFGSTSWGLLAVEFDRAGDGSVSGLRVSGGRVRNLKFQRVEEWRD
jgi:CubicO group peptidase (beta-lactamase class C family)